MLTAHAILEREAFAVKPVFDLQSHAHKHACTHGEERAVQEAQFTER